MSTLRDSEPLSAAWAGLREHLERRFRQLCDELRHYPTPIARCDEQLPKLIEQRDHARTELERMSLASGSDSGVSTEAVRRFLAGSGATDDDIESALRGQLQLAAGVTQSARSG